MDFPQENAINRTRTYRTGYGTCIACLLRRDRSELVTFTKSNNRCEWIRRTGGEIIKRRLEVKAENSQFLCVHHFPPECFDARGRLINNALPFILDREMYSTIEEPTVTGNDSLVFTGKPALTFTEDDTNITDSEEVDKIKTGCLEYEDPLDEETDFSTCPVKQGFLSKSNTMMETSLDSSNVGLNQNILSRKILSPTTFHNRSIVKNPIDNRWIGRRMLLKVLPAHFRKSHKAEFERDILKCMNREKYSHLLLSKEKVLTLLMDYICDNQRFDISALAYNLNVEDLFDLLAAAMEETASADDRCTNKIFFDTYNYYQGQFLMIPLHLTICPYLFNPNGFIRDVGRGKYITFLNYDNVNGYPIIAINSVCRLEDKSTEALPSPKKFIFLPPFSRGVLDEAGVVIINEKDVIMPWIKNEDIFHRNQGRVWKPRCHIDARTTSPSTVHTAEDDIESANQMSANGCLEEEEVRDDGGLIDQPNKGFVILNDSMDLSKQTTLITVPSLFTIDCPVVNKKKCDYLGVRGREDNKEFASQVKPYNTKRLRLEEYGSKCFVTKKLSAKKKLRLVEQAPMTLKLKYKKYEIDPCQVDALLVRTIDTEFSILPDHKKQKMFQAANAFLSETTFPSSLSHDLDMNQVVNLVDKVKNNFKETRPKSIFAPRSYESPYIYQLMPTVENWDEIWNIIEKEFEEVTSLTPSVSNEIRQQNAMMEIILFGTQFRSAFTKYCVENISTFHEVHNRLFHGKGCRLDIVHEIHKRGYLINTSGGGVFHEFQDKEAVNIVAQCKDDQSITFADSLKMINDMLISPQQDTKMQLVEFIGDKDRLLGLIDKILTYMAIPHWLKNVVVYGSWEYFVEGISAEEICERRVIVNVTFNILTTLLATFIDFNNIKSVDDVFVIKYFTPKQGCQIVPETTFSLNKLLILKKFWRKWPIPDEIPLVVTKSSDIAILASDTPPPPRNYSNTEDTISEANFEMDNKQKDFDDQNVFQLPPTISEDGIPALDLMKSIIY